MRYRKPAAFTVFGMAVGAAAVFAYGTLLPGTPPGAAAPASAQSTALTPPAAVVTGPRSPGRVTGGDGTAAQAFNPGTGAPSKAVQTAVQGNTPSEVILARASAADALVPRDPAPRRREVLTVERGDTLMNMLIKAGVDRGEAHASIEALSEVYDPRRLRPGHEITLTFTVDPDQAEAFHGLSLEPDPARRVLASRDEAGDFAATEVKAALRGETLRFEGAIDSSLYLAATAQGVSPAALAAIISAFSYDVDFQRDIHPGDAFEVLVERQVAPNGQRVGEPLVQYASLTLKGKRLAIFRYEDSEGDVDFYDAEGRSVRKALLRTPINGARLSSGFGKRRHPVLGYSKMHRGVDFAAPTGTPIFAAGDGVIERANVYGSYGNYVRIRHNSTYNTAYAHLSRFGKGITAGKRIRQGDVIGYVGTTGRSTGPHLHYEVMRSGTQVNPMTVSFPSGRELEGKELVRFAAAREELERTYAALPRSTTVADTDGETTATTVARN